MLSFLNIVMAQIIEKSCLKKGKELLILQDHLVTQRARSSAAIVLI